MTFSDKLRLREFAASRPELYEMLNEVFSLKGNGTS